MKSNDEIVSVEVYAGTYMQASMVKTLLENAEIQTFLKDEIMGMLNPWWTAPGGAGSVTVVVSSVDAEKARSIIAEYEKNIEDDE